MQRTDGFEINILESYPRVDSQVEGLTFETIDFAQIVFLKDSREKKVNF
jgi:hypothetical protein